jgi:hypothetical protein
VLALSHNWTKPGWVSSHGGLSAVIDDDGTGIQGASPDFVDAGMQDFHLLPTSKAVDAGGGLRPDVLPENLPVAQYREPQGIELRPADGLPDLGAFELPEPGVGTGCWAGFVLLGTGCRRRGRRASDPSAAA